ncbi:hypothetical protein FRUB_09095 [Fimbriiglobus ruber]|uniref:Uncharacterized protein n=1 Tax=Fimbriiglobus ruber TaxID=1908690 RepID=A0A225D4W2_9BACT|nr:hypothetical protein FRUB_09095 [Fimbriiglobus ruber]
MATGTCVVIPAAAGARKGKFGGEIRVEIGRSGDFPLVSTLPGDNSRNRELGQPLSFVSSLR